MPCLTAGREGQGETHVFFLPLELTVHTLHLPEPLPEGKFCCNPLSFKFIVGLRDKRGPGKKRVMAA